MSANNIFFASGILPIKKPDNNNDKQNSYYYFCEINGDLGALNLEDYEEDLGFHPKWVNVESALEQNKKVLAESNPAPRWTKRDTFVLGILAENKEELI